MDSIQKAYEKATRFYDATPTLRHEDYMEGQGSKQGDTPTNRTAFDGRPSNKEKSPMDRTRDEDATR